MLEKINNIVHLTTGQFNKSLAVFSEVPGQEIVLVHLRRTLLKDGCYPSIILTNLKKFKFYTF